MKECSAVRFYSEIHVYASVNRQFSQFRRDSPKFRVCQIRRCRIKAIFAMFVIMLDLPTNGDSLHVPCDVFASIGDTDLASSSSREAMY